MRKTNIQTTILLLFALLAGIFPARLALANEITPEKVVLLVNQERQKENLSDLELNSTLSKIAENKAKDMLDEDYFAHTSPEGKTPWFWFEREGYDYKYAGENLAINFTTAEKQNEAWMKSPTHRKNILNPNFSQTGVAVVRGVIKGKDTIITVQEFGRPNENALVAGDASGKKDLFSAATMKYEESGYRFESQESGLEKNILTGIASNMKSADFIRLMKGSALISAFAMMILFFASFAHRLSRIGEFFGKFGRKISKIEDREVDFHEKRLRIAIKFFPVDMRKIKVTHLHHCKQRE